VPARPDLLSTDDNPDADLAGTRGWAFGRPPVALWFGLSAFCVAVLSWAVHGMYLFADDFIFLSQAREKPFDLTYLRSGLFQHFSPVSRLVNEGLIHVLPHWRAAPFAGLVVMDVLVVASAVLLMIALFGKTWLGWVGTLLLGSSLTLVPNLHWWTAGLNVLPALAGVLAGFGAMVLYLRGRSAWWAGLALLSYLVAISDYELGMLMPLYLGLWLLLFGRRVLAQPLRPVLRRSAWVWALLLIMLVLAAYNYRAYYYKPAPKASLHLLVDGLGVTLFHALLPSLVGIHADVGGGSWDTFGVVVGAVLLVVLVGWTLARSLGAWRGWAFAFAGWVVPALALLVNRLGYNHNTRFATNLIYQPLAVAMFLVGVLEAVLAAGLLTRFAALPRPPVRVLRAGLAAGTLLCVLMGLAWVHSVNPSMRVQLISKASREYVGNVQRGAAEAARGGPYGLLSSTAPSGLISHSFIPFNVTTRVVGLYDPDLPFDVPAARMFAIDPRGNVYPVTLHTLAQAEPADPTNLEPATTDTVSVAGAADVHSDPSRGLCFRTEAATAVQVVLTAPATGAHLVIDPHFTVSAPTPERAYVLQVSPAKWVAANGDPRTWRPNAPGLLETVAATSIRGVQFARFTPGVSMCISSVEVSDAVRSGG
jgi:hypothetical protein